MDSKLEAILGDFRGGDELVLNTSDGDSGILELVAGLKDAGYRVVENGPEAIVFQLPIFYCRPGESLFHNAFRKHWNKLAAADGPNSLVELSGTGERFNASNAGQWAFKESHMHGSGPDYRDDSGEEWLCPEEIHDNSANWIWATDKVEMKETLKVNLENRDDQTVFVVLYFKTAYRNEDSDSSRPSTTALRLVLDEVRFGVENSLLTKNELGAFIHEIEIVARPAPSWLQHCVRFRNVRPALSPPTFVPQVGSSTGIGMTVGKDPSAAISYQTTKSVTTVSPAFAWLPASSEERAKSVKWGWRINRWNDSTPFDVNRPSSFASRFGTGDFRELPFHRPRSPPGEVNYSRNFLDAEAIWEVPTAAIEKSGSIQWKIDVRLCTARAHKVVIIPPKLALKCRVDEARFDFYSNVSLKVDRDERAPKKFGFKFLLDFLRF